VRQLGLIGLASLLIAALIGVVFVVQRLRGVTELSSLGIFALSSAAVLAVAGVSIFSLGATFNYLVALFHKQPVRQGVWGKPLFNAPLERHFGWLGLVAMLLGIIGGLGSLILGLNGWPQTRLWFWQLLSAGTGLVGLQLVVSWFIMRALAELSEREVRVAGDLLGREVSVG